MPKYTDRHESKRENVHISINNAQTKEENILLNPQFCLKKKILTIF